MLERASSSRPLVVGIGGTPRSDSTSERALVQCLRHLEHSGTRTRIFSARDLDLPMYGSAVAAQHEGARRLVDALRSCNAVVVSSPAYHGSVSGIIKNALDYAEDLRTDDRPYLDGRAMGLIVCSAGAQAGGTTLAAMRSIAHALRAWPTPYAAMVATDPKPFEGARVAPEVAQQLELVAKQVADFIAMRSAVPSEHLRLSRVS